MDVIIGYHYFVLKIEMEKWASMAMAMRWSWTLVKVEMVGKERRMRLTKIEVTRKLNLITPWMRIIVSLMVLTLEVIL
jgi:hypothetical protein